MRAFLSLLLPLLIVLGLLAWGASEAVQRTSQRWFEHEMQARAELLVRGVREAAAGALRHEDRPRARKVLADLSRDERVSAAALCDGGGALLASTPRRPETLGCQSVRARGPGDGPIGSAWSFEAQGADGPVHVSAVPVEDGEGPAGFAVVLEDTAWAARRGRQVRRLLAALRPVRLPGQLVHGDLGGNVLFADGAPPAVIDFSPYWRPPGLALAIAAVDALTWSGADPAILDALDGEPELDQLLARAHVGRLVTEVVIRRGDPDPSAGLDTVARTGEPVTALVMARLALG